MKILTKEEEKAHYNATLRGGLYGGVLGLAVGGLAVVGAHHRFPTFRHLTLPMKTFLVTSSGTFIAIVNADRYSRKFEFARDPSRQYRDRASLDQDAVRENLTKSEKLMDWGRENRYPLVTVSWIASMGIALGLVGRNPYLSKAQKLVQARVYAQGLTLAVLIATAAFEVGDASKGKGRWETVKVLDPDDPEHKHMIEKRIHHEAYEGEDLWRDMVATEERKIAARRNAAHHEAGEHKSEEKKGDSPPGYTPSSKPDPMATGKANKDRIDSESQSAGSVNHEEAAKTEAKNMKRQNGKERDAKLSAVVDGAKVENPGRGGILSSEWLATSLAPLGK